MVDLQKGDVVKFKSREALEAEFGVDERGVIDCECKFLPEMWDEIDTNEVYVVDRIVRTSVFLEGMENNRRIYSTDCFILADFEETPLFEGAPRITRYANVSGRLKCTSACIAALFSPLTIPVKDKSYLDSYNYGLYDNHRVPILINHFNVREPIDEDTLNTNIFDVSNCVVLMKCEKFPEELPKSDFILYSDDELLVYRGTINSYGIVFKEERNDLIFKAYKAIMTSIAAPKIFEEGQDINEYLEFYKSYYEDVGEFLIKEKKARDIKEVCDQLKEKRRVSITNKISRIERYILELEDKIRMFATQLREERKNILYFDANYENTDDFCMLIKEAPNLRSVTLDGNRLAVEIVQPLLYWEDAWFEDNTRGITFENCPEWKQELLVEIFRNKTISVMIQQRVVLNADDGHINFSDVDEYNEGIPNPHHKYHNCWGDNESLISRALIEGDYATALNQTIAATASFNLSDGTVWGNFVRDELTDFADVKCLTIVETGEVISIKEYKDRKED